MKTGSLEDSSAAPSTANGSTWIPAPPTAPIFKRSELASLTGKSVVTTLFGREHAQTGSKRCVDTFPLHPQNEPPKRPLTSKRCVEA